MRYIRTIQVLLALAAIAFGIATIKAGVHVLAGFDPGYVVFRPLLIFNTAMGAVYAAAGILIWRSIERGKHAAAIIFVLNFLVLGTIGCLHALGSAVAIESFGAMSLRTVVWLVLFLVLKRMSYRNNAGRLEN